MRIVSLLPSATEIVCLLGGRDWLVGISHECDFPSGLDLPILTSQRTPQNPDSGIDAAAIDRQVSPQLASGNSLYDLNARALEQLRPDLILTQDLCSVCSIDLETVRAVVRDLKDSTGHEPVILSLNPQTIEGMLDDVLRVGEAIDAGARAQQAMVRLRERLWRAQEFVNPYLDGPVVGFLEWTDPIYVAGHWNVQMIERAGGRHPLNPTRDPDIGGVGAGMQAGDRLAGPSIRVPTEEFVRTQPEFVIIAPCGLTLDQSRAEARRLGAQSWFSELAAVRHNRVAIVDGNQMFNRPGPRLVDAFEFLVGFLNDRPAVIPEGFPWELAQPGRRP